MMAIMQSTECGFRDQLSATQRIALLKLEFLLKEICWWRQVAEQIEVTSVF